MEHWLIVDLIIVSAYGVQHTLLTTRPAKWIYELILPAYTWNIVYSAISVVVLVFGFRSWESSGVVLFHLIPGSVAYHISTIGLALSLFLFFYCFRFTTSFWQWLGVRQVIAKLMQRNMPDYYRVRKEGIKRYIRFPHHTCLVFFFWLHPAMTLDTLLLAIAATIYLYVGTYHQDLRGLRLLGADWAVYRGNTSLLFPSPRVALRMVSDLFGSADRTLSTKGSKGTGPSTGKDVKTAG